MPILLWDQPGDRIYENGLDRGVLYLTDGSAVPWNGLTSVVEKPDRAASPVYFDGMKTNDLVTVGDYSASLKAMTYPNEFLEFEGLGVLNGGVFVGDQPPGVFSLSYRTHVGDDFNKASAYYKIHLIYNATAIPTDKNYASFTADPAVTEFEWSITAIPDEIPGFRPSAHIIFDSRYTDASVLEQIELMLYGGSGEEGAHASLWPHADLMDYLSGWFLLQITDNKDGTWTATENESSEGVYITMISADEFSITTDSAVFLDADTYTISNDV